MSKKKVHVNKPLPSKVEVAKLKKFEQVYKASQSTGGSSLFGGKALLGILSIVAVASVIYLWSNAGSSISETKPEQAFISPPLEGLDVLANVYQINPNKDTMVVHETGTSIDLSSGIFVHENGNPVKETVQLSYREFHSPLEGYLAGIPMEYDSGGTTYTFESAGMFEIKAQSNGKQVFLKEGMEIPISMVSNTDIKTNFYYLDTVKKNWEYIGQDKLMHLPMLSETGELISVVPKLGNELFYQFNLEVNPELYPELAVFEGIYFQVDTAEKNFSEKLYDVAWKQIHLDRKGADCYELTLVGKANHIIKAEPVLDSSNFGEAKKDFQNRYSSYCSKLIVKQEAKKAYLKNLLAFNAKQRLKANALAKENQYEKKQQKILGYKMEQKLDSISKKEKVKDMNRTRALAQQLRPLVGGSSSLIYRRGVIVSSLGLHNCDRLAPLIAQLEENKVACKFTANDLEIESLKGVINNVELGRNLRRQTRDDKMLVIESTPTVVWFATSDRKLAIVQWDKIMEAKKAYQKEKKIVYVPVEIREPKEGMAYLNTLFK